LEIRINCEKCKKKKKKVEKQTECHMIEPNPWGEGDNPSIGYKFLKFTFFLDSLIHIRILKQELTYIATGL
jgi:hypothetical protein